MYEYRKMIYHKNAEIAILIILPVVPNMIMSTMLQD